MEAGFSLGSNQGDRIELMREAKRRLLAESDVRWVAQSSLYETEPVAVAAEYAHLRFINAVLILESDRSATQWMELLHTVEAAMGRERISDRNAPRTMDVDLIYIGDACIDRGDIIVPHPRWAARRFVVQPLAEVRPDLMLPGTGSTVSKVLQELVGEEVKRLDAEW